MVSYIPQSVSAQREPDILTFQDLVDSLLDFFAFDRRTERNVRMAQRAVLKAVDDVCKMHAWRHFRRAWTFTTDAPHETGTVAYTSATRTVTFAGTTLPTWARYGTLQVLDSAGCGPEYEVERVVNTTQLILREESCPADDFAATDDYRLVRRYYPAPIDLKEIQNVYDISNGRDLQAMVNPEINALRGWPDREPDDPRGYILRGLSSSLGTSILELTPPPIEELQYAIAYIARPRPLRIERFVTSATATLANTTITVGDTLPEGVDGTVVRFSSSARIPTSTTGAVDAQGNRYYAQRVILSRASSTTFVIDAALDIALSAFGCILSDYVDIYPPVMLAAVQAFAEFEMGRSIRSDPAQLNRMERRAEIELRRAMESDSPGKTLVRSGAIWMWPIIDYQTEYGSAWTEMNP